MLLPTRRASATSGYFVRTTARSWASLDSRRDHANCDTAKWQSATACRYSANRCRCFMAARNSTTQERLLPRNGSKVRFVVCPLCQKPRRALYAWRVNRTRANCVFPTSWECRECTGLRYASEGGALRLRPLPIVLEGRLFVIRENSLRPESCWPYVFVNPLDVKSIL